MLVTMDLLGTASELDEKFGRLLCLGNWLLEYGITFDIRVLTGNGVLNWTVCEGQDLQKCLEDLLCEPCATDGTIRDRAFGAAWHHHVGGERGEK